MGFGFAEIGTVTPLPQPGNPRPRVFRLAARPRADQSARIQQRRPRRGAGPARSAAAAGIVGVNVGANKDAPDRAADYVEGIRRFYDVAGYFRVNVSSPNTPGLRDLQAPAALDDLLARVLAARAELMAAGKPRRPIVVKLAPDLAEADLAPVVERAVAPRRRRHRHRQHHAVARRRRAMRRCAREAGGLSGRPLFHRSTVMLARVYRLTQGRIPLIGIGGIDSGAAAIAKIEAGATLLQLYTGLVFEGPGLIARIKRELVQYVEHSGSPASATPPAAAPRNGPPAPSTTEHARARHPDEGREPMHRAAVATQLVFCYGATTCRISAARWTGFRPSPE